MAEVSKTIANHRRLHKSEYEKLILLKNAKHDMLPILTCRKGNSATEKPSRNLDEIMIWQCARYIFLKSETSFWNSWEKTSHNWVKIDLSACA